MKDNDAAEAAEQIMERQRCCVKVSVSTAFVFASELTSYTACLIVRPEQSEDVEQPVEKLYVS